MLICHFVISFVCSENLSSQGINQFELDDNMHVINIYGKSVLDVNRFLDKLTLRVPRCALRAHEGDKFVMLSGNDIRKHIEHEI